VLKNEPKDNILHTRAHTQKPLHDHSPGSWGSSGGPTWTIHRTAGANDLLKSNQQCYITEGKKDSAISVSSKL